MPRSDCVYGKNVSSELFLKPPFIFLSAPLLLRTQIGKEKIRSILKAVLYFARFCTGIYLPLSEPLYPRSGGTNYLHLVWDTFLQQHLFLLQWPKKKGSSYVRTTRLFLSRKERHSRRWKCLQRRQPATAMLQAATALPGRTRPRFEVEARRLPRFQKHRRRRCLPRQRG